MTIENVEQLEDLLSEPRDYVIEALARVEGDIIVLGAGGKMGPTLARMARRASDSAGVSRRIIAVSRFSSDEARSNLDAVGVETIRCDLLDPEQISELPDAANVVFMVGMKFGSSENRSLTWAMNAYLPGVVCRRYRGSRIVAFSTGNVYPLVAAASGGSKETDEPGPVGEYAMSTLGRERVFEHFSRSMSIPLSIIRLNYACELRYGVLVDIAQRVFAGEPVELTTGYLNAVWQADANAMSLAALAHACVPGFVLNVAGPETLSVRRVAEQLASAMGKEPVFSGSESPDAFLSNSEKAQRLFGVPKVSVDQMISWVADWVMRGGESLGKPTHFNTRDGKF